MKSKFSLAGFLSINLIFSSVLLPTAFGQATQAAADAPNSVAPSKVFVRFTAFSYRNSADKNILFERCTTSENRLNCSPMGKGLYSLMSLKSLADDEMNRAHLSAGATVLMGALAAAAMLPVAAGVTLSGVFIVGGAQTVSPVLGGIALVALGGTFTATTLYLLGFDGRVAAGLGVAGGLAIPLSRVGFYSSPLAFGVMLPLSAGWKVLDLMGLNPIRRYQRAFKMRDLYQAASESGSYNDVVEIEEILSRTRPSAPHIETLNPRS